MNEQYTLGYDQVAVNFVSRRRLDPDGAVILPFLRPDMTVLDCGCGPGTISADIAAILTRGRLEGVDLSASQVALASERAARLGLGNARFQEASVYALPFADASFDLVFSHALLEHLSDPVAAVRECLRVLRPGGVVAACTPDWGGFLFSPAPPDLVAAIDAYTGMQARNGGDPRTGHRLREHFLAAGATGVRARARYENYDPLSTIIDLLAWQLDGDGQPAHAGALRRWAADGQALFAQAWVSCVGRKPA